MTTKQRIYVIIMVLGCYLLGYTIGYSYINPGKLPKIDHIRTSIQGVVVEWIDNSLLGKKYTEIILKEHNYDRPLTREQLSGLVGGLRPGDIIMTHSNPTITTTHIPGYRKHIALYIGTKETRGNIIPKLDTTYDDHTQLIIDATSDGVQIRPLQHLSNLHTVSVLHDIEILRLNTKKKTIKKIIQAAIEHVGKEYDYDLRLDNDTEIYCSELLVTILAENGITITTYSRAVARAIITPQNIYDQLLANKQASLVGGVFSTK